jgi:hypothetical protein
VTGSSEHLLSAGELGALADSLRALLTLLDAGDLMVSAATRYRLEGAIAALDTALGRSSTLLTYLSGTPSAT